MKTDLELILTVEIKDPQLGGYGGLRINDTVRISPRSFMEVCAIIAQFDALTQKLKSGKEST